MTIDWSEIRDWLLVVGGIIAFAKGLYEYQRAQRWKRAEWVASEMKAFLDDPLVRNALMMLDWNDRRLPLLLHAPMDGSATAFEYEEKMLLHALSSRTSPQTRDYSDAELSIRDSFDRLLDGFERQESFIKAGLVTYSDLEPHIGYWLAIIRDPENPRKSAAARARIRAYISDYGYSGTEELLDRSMNSKVVPHQPSNVAA